MITIKVPKEKSSKDPNADERTKNKLKASFINTKAEQCKAPKNTKGNKTETIRDEQTRNSWKHGQSRQGNISMMQI